MSRILDALRRAESLKQGRQVARGAPRPYLVVTVTSNKGGVGKTTFALNLAVYLRDMRADLPILVLGLDEQDTVQRVLAIGDTPRHANVVSGLRTGTFESSVRLGQYGVHYVPSSRQVNRRSSTGPVKGHGTSTASGSPWPASPTSLPSWRKGIKIPAQRAISRFKNKGAIK